MDEGVSKFMTNLPNNPVIFTETDHQTWRHFIERQSKIVSEIACKEFLDGLSIINFSTDKIPHHTEISTQLRDMTGWSLIPVEGLVSTTDFFNLLTNKKFPVTQKIRTIEELDFYSSPDPDIIHEYFGHCPLLTNQSYADFMQQFGRFSIQQTCENQIFLARLYWFTIEFGLINTPEGQRIYGAGILPSSGEISSVISDDSVIKSFNIIEIARTPFEVHKKQRVYFAIDSFEQLYEILKLDMDSLKNKVDKLGEFVN